MEDIYNSLMELLFNVEIKANVEYQNATFYKLLKSIFCIIYNSEKIQFVKR